MILYFLNEPYNIVLTSKSVDCFKLAGEEAGKEFSTNLADLVPVNVISASSGLGTSLLNIICISSERVPVFWVCTTIISFFIPSLYFFDKARLRYNLRSTLAGFVDTLDGLAVLGWFKEDDEDLSRQLVGDGGGISTGHALELAKDSGEFAHPK